MVDSFLCLGSAKLDVFPFTAFVLRRASWLLAVVILVVKYQSCFSCVTLSENKVISQNVKLFLENAVFKTDFLTSILRALGPRINGVAEWV